MKKITKNLNYYLIDDVKDSNFAINFEKTTLDDKYGMCQNDLRTYSNYCFDQEILKYSVAASCTFISKNPSDCNIESIITPDDLNFECEYNDDAFISFDESPDYDYDEDYIDIDESFDYDFDYENDREFDGDEEIYGNIDYEDYYNY